MIELIINISTDEKIHLLNFLLIKMSWIFICGRKSKTKQLSSKYLLKSKQLVYIKNLIKN